MYYSAATSDACNKCAVSVVVIRRGLMIYKVHKFYNAGIWKNKIEVRGNASVDKTNRLPSAKVGVFCDVFKVHAVLLLLLGKNFYARVNISDRFFVRQCNDVVQFGANAKAIRKRVWVKINVQFFKNLTRFFKIETGNDDIVVVICGQNIDLFKQNWVYFC